MKLLNKLIIADKKLLTIEVSDKESQCLDNERRFSLYEADEAEAEDEAEDNTKSVYVIIADAQSTSFIEKLLIWQQKEPLVVRIGEFVLHKATLQWECTVHLETEEGYMSKQRRKGNLAQAIIKHILSNNISREKILEALRRDAQRRSIIF
jgi:hypothetical protein